jgi:hypothetical protein
MDVAAVYRELYDRIPPLASAAVDGMSIARLTEPPTTGTNTIAWLVWHAARVQDHHVAELLGSDQIWVDDGWAARFGLDPDPTNIGFGHTAEQVLEVRPQDPSALLEYLDAVYARTKPFLATLSADDLDRIVDRRWDPPVTLGVRLVSIADDGLQHVGQAAYARGMLTR